MAPDIKPLVDIAQINDDILVQIHADIMFDFEITAKTRELVELVKARLDHETQRAYEKLARHEEL